MRKFAKIPFKVIELEKFKSGTKFKYGGSQAFVMAFCYPESGPILVKGMFEKVDTFLKTKLGPCHYNYAIFQDGKPRYSNYWLTNVSHTFIRNEKRADGRKVFKLSDFRESPRQLQQFRKVPLRFLKEFKNIEKHSDWRES